ncbi:hypothetical protein PVAP13_5NG290162 [Panicum virgatum]|uniref:Secreted protein n=1 Tax=Panicum virgatum TaxID=38727 RepID=A0A8T0RTS8_PANVG|nr:hypothetical protein PVAP13_5NG290162 [Panicum virgatum]
MVAVLTLFITTSLTYLQSSFTVDSRICRHILFVVSEVAYARIDCINWVGLSTVRTFRVHLSQTSDL